MSDDLVVVAGGDDVDEDDSGPLFCVPEDVAVEDASINAGV